MKVLGIDPGSKQTAWCVLERALTSAVWLGSGMHDSRAEALVAVLHRWEPALVIVERPTRVPPGRPFDPGPLMDTAWAGGMAFGAVSALGVPVMEIFCRDWRGALCGRQPNGGQASDAMVKASIEGCVRGVPTQTNNHVRDAAGVAFVGGLLHAARARRRADVPTPDR